MLLPHFPYKDKDMVKFMKKEYLEYNKINRTSKDIENNLSDKDKQILNDFLRYCRTSASECALDHETCISDLWGFSQVRVTFDDIQSCSDDLTSCIDDCDMD